MCHFEVSKLFLDFFLLDLPLFRTHDYENPTWPHVIILLCVIRLFHGPNDKPDASHPMSKKSKRHHEQRQYDYTILRIPKNDKK